METRHDRYTALYWALLITAFIALTALGFRDFRLLGAGFIAACGLKLLTEWLEARGDA